MNRKNMDISKWKLLLCVMASTTLFVACGPSKQMIRLQNEVVRLQREKDAEVSKLQKEKFEAMQVQRVALERQQKSCKSELIHMRSRHRKLSFRVAKSTRQVQRILMQIMSDTLLMPFHEEAPPEEPAKPAQTSAAPPPTIVGEPKNDVAPSPSPSPTTSAQPTPKK